MVYLSITDMKIIISSYPLTTRYKIIEYLWIQIKKKWVYLNMINVTECFITFLWCYCCKVLICYAKLLHITTTANESITDITEPNNHMHIIAYCCAISLCIWNYIYEFICYIVWVVAMICSDIYILMI